MFTAPRVVALLKLGAGFDDERIEFGTLGALDILRIGIFITGGLLFINSISTFLYTLYWTFKGSIAGRGLAPDREVHLAVSGVKVLVGYLLATNYDFLARRLKPRDANASS